MPRPLRSLPGNVVYHVMNRAAAGGDLFGGEGDYRAFERVLVEAVGRQPGVRVCGYVLMPTHWHLVVWPREDGELSGFMRWLTMTHVQRWHARRGSTGRGHVYQGRFKSFPVQRDEHVLKVLRYVERNPLRAGLVKRAEAWRWGSLGVREGARAGEPAGDIAGGLPGEAELRGMLSDWPVGEEGVKHLGGWLKWVNSAEGREELEALQRAVARGLPFGGERWVKSTAARNGISLRPRGRPRGSVKKVKG